MPSLRVAGASLPVTTDIDRNAASIRRAVEYAIAQRAHILLTPEGSLSGYTHEFDQAKTAAELGEITALAVEGGIGLALGTCFREPDGCVYNQIRMYGRGGEYLGFHAKTLRCGTMTAPPMGEINEYAPADLRVFEFGGITVGCLICNDLWANPMCTPMPDPHLTQQLAVMGAEVILHAVNGGRTDDEWLGIGRSFHEANLRMRARAGDLWIVTVDNSYPETLPTSSPCGVIRPDGSWACTVEAQGEQLFAYTIEL